MAPALGSASGTSRSDVQLRSEASNGAHQSSSASLQHTNPLGVPEQQVTHMPHTRLQDNNVKPKVFSDGAVRYDRLGLGVVREPQSLHEALEDKRCRQTMDEEFTALMKNKT
jgi:hypothetical protein